MNPCTDPKCDDQEETHAEHDTGAERIYCPYCSQPSQNQRRQEWVTFAAAAVSEDNAMPYHVADKAMRAADIADCMMLELEKRFKEGEK